MHKHVHILKYEVKLANPYRTRHRDPVLELRAPEFRGSLNNRFLHSMPRIACGLGVCALFLICAPGLVSASGKAASVLQATAELPALRAFEGPTNKKPAKPVFTLPDLDGATRTLDAYRGRPVLVHFFATWCEPCRPEMQALKQMSQHPAAQDLQILAISVNEPRSRLQRFFDNLPVTFPILMDEDRDIAKAWDVASLPTTFLLGADLVPRLYAERDIAWDELDIAGLLQELTRPASPASISKQGRKE